MGRLNYILLTNTESTENMTRTIGWRTAALALTVALTSLAAPAAAHVSVDSTSSERGGYGMITFRVPNESDTSATTKVAISIPTDTPLASVSVQSKPGWKVSTTTSKLPKPVKAGELELTKAVTEVSWTATGDGIPVAGFDTFAISGGPLPDAEELVLPATQMYADGTVVEWNTVQTGDVEPEHPAPMLTLTESTGGGHHGPEAKATEHSATETDNDDSGPDPIALIALGLAAVALVLSVKKNRTRA